MGNECAGVIFVNDGKLLFQLRDNKEGINYPGLWGLFGGGIEPGENPMGTAIREIQEELGVVLDEGDLEEVATYDFEGFLTHVFKSGKKLDLSEIIQTEGSDMRFFELNEIFGNKKFIPHIDDMIKENLSKFR